MTALQGWIVIGLLVTKRTLEVREPNSRTNAHCTHSRCTPTKGRNGVTPRIVTTYLVVHKGQILCKRYCKLGHQTPYNRHQQRRGSPYYTSQYEHG